MISAYLWFNGIAYVALGLWCAASVTRTADAIGFKQLDASGRCEYTAVYGGLQLALGLVFIAAGSIWQFTSLGLAFAVLLYVCLCLFRAIGLIRFWPVAPLTLAFAGFELLMLLVGGALLFAAYTPA